MPLVCMMEDDKPRLVAGHRRLAAAKKIGLSTVPVMFHKFKVAEAKEVSFAENLFREDLTPVEMAAGLKDTIESGAMTVDELAAAVHRSKNWVGSMIAMLVWPADVLAAIHEGWLSVSAGNNLANVLDDVYRDFLLKNAAESGATARTTAAWLQAWRSMQPVEDAIIAEPVAGEARAQPAVPQAPCICCGDVFRTDALSHVPACAPCIRVIREVGASR